MVEAAEARGCRRRGIRVINSLVLELVVAVMVRVGCGGVGLFSTKRKQGDWNEKQ